MSTVSVSVARAVRSYSWMMWLAYLVPDVNGTVNDGTA